MNTSRKVCCVMLCIFWLANVADAQLKEIPPTLEPWKGWVLWGEENPDCPTPFNTSEQHICSWPSRLTLTADNEKGSWQIQVRVFEESWVSLPGNGQTWPFNVRANDEPFAVVERNEVPSVRLAAGLHDLSGEFRWSEMPQRIAVPREIGILSLVVGGEAVPIPNWDSSGHVWLKRLRLEPAEKDLLSKQVFRVVEDGIPLWLRTEIELTVSGRSREEQLGWILPEGWQLSMVESPIPVAVDEQGRMKAQVRAGTWRIQVGAFRNTDIDELRFASDAQPLTVRELVGFRAKPDFRIAEFEGVQQVDVNQTTFPEKWRDLPVFAWQTDSPVRLVEKMRGMGLQRPQGLTINRYFWLDEDGQNITYRDQFSGQMQQIWRLDVTGDQQLGAVRVDDQPQLITTNPQTGAQGVELRNRGLNMDAIGRVPRSTKLSATGWQTDAESLRLTLSLPPGWRVFALFGADRVEGDWLTAWSLLDLFLLLVFSVAVFRLWGIPAGLVALVAFGLSYHEPGAPRYTWLFLLIPLALLRVVREGNAKRCLDVLKYGAMLLLMLNLVPFVAGQIQSAIYPQLETQGVPYRARDMFEVLEPNYPIAQNGAIVQERQGQRPSMGILSRIERSRRRSMSNNTNLYLDPKAKVQTGPAEPEWRWNQVHCYWSGPVSKDQMITPVLISRPVHQGLTVLRLALLFVLAAIIFGVRTIRIPFLRRTTGAAVILAVSLSTSAVTAQIPDQEMLNKLRERLLEPSDAYPRAAEISSVDLTLNEGRIVMRAEVHAAIDVAVPLPGRLPNWSPLSVKIDDQDDAVVCRRDDGYLWVTVPQGVHQIAVEGWLAGGTEWEWSFLLTPRRVSIDAPGWNVTGVRPNGMPEDQVFFARRQQPTEGGATYGQKNFRAVAAVDRHLEVGLDWKLHNTVRRLSSAGKAVSLKVPLLPGESVLTSNVVLDGGAIEVNLAANQADFTWESEIQSVEEIQLNAAQTGQWVERWFLESSPVWNVTFSGLAPVFESSEEKLIPVWHPWPGEGVTLAFRRPEAISGEIMTVQKIRHETILGPRQRTMELNLEVESSLGSDFAIELDAEAEVSSLTVNDQTTPVRREGRKLFIPVRPGKQSVHVAWTTSKALNTVIPVGDVKLPVDGANVTTIMQVPESRWILWAGGPLRGPAVRFWVVLVVSVLVALALGSAPLSPLRRFEWVLLAIGLTQVHVAAAILVVAWLFLVAMRGKQDPEQLRDWQFNLLQVALGILTVVALGVFIVVVGKGLLGNPDMFVVGNGSSGNYLNWFQPRAGLELPEPYIISISVLFFRLLMLMWALWLATALLRWLRTGWTAFSHGGYWKLPVVSPTPSDAEPVEPESGAAQATP